MADDSGSSVTTRAVVLDSGTGSVKAGFAGSNFPAAVFPTVLGRPILRAGATKVKTDSGAELKDLMLGDETIPFRSYLDVTCPVKLGVVRKKDDMVLLWDYCFSKKLKIDPSETLLSVSESPMYGNDARESNAEIMFERFGFKGMQITQQSVLVLYAAGVQTGLAVDCGDSISFCSPVYDGYGIKKAERQMFVGGRLVTEQLSRLMQRRGYGFTTSADMELLRVIKEKFCYAAVDIKRERKLSDATTVLEKGMTLPDGSTCVIGRERFEATELLFDPGLMGIESKGLSESIFDSVNAADVDLRTSLYTNIILAGGSTMFPGMSSRIEADIKQKFFETKLGGDPAKLRTSNFKVRIMDAPRRKYMAFLGGAVYAALTVDAPDMWVSKADYEEQGAARLHEMVATV